MRYITITGFSFLALSNRTAIRTFECVGNKVETSVNSNKVPVIVLVIPVKFHNRCHSDLHIIMSVISLKVHMITHSSVNMIH